MVTRESDEPDVTALQSAVRESRTVLDHQIASIGNIDDLAMRTLRTSVLVIGVLVSVAGLTGRSILGWISPLALACFVAGFSSLFGTVLFGLATLSTSSLPLGISTSHRRYLVDAALDRREWTQLLLEEYDTWEQKLHRIERTNSRWLHYQLWTFFGGIVSARTRHSCYDVTGDSMRKMTESDRDELEPAMSHMAPPWARRFFGFFGVDTYTDDIEED